MIDDYLAKRVNTGPWVASYTLNHLRDHRDANFVLPICSLATPYQQCEALGDLILPPLYHEALNEDLKQALIRRIAECFPRYEADVRSELRVVELPRQSLPPAQPDPAQPGTVLAFSVDTAVEEHGPHLPLSTDTIQSYSVLQALAEEFDQLQITRPLEYGQLTWGLPFGFSIDVTADLLTKYVTAYVNALDEWQRPQAIYVVDVHGSITHRQAIADGLRRSNCATWSFRWLHEPLAEFASQRGDQHAGGVETALVQRVSRQLLDPAWWPHRIDELARFQMPFKLAVELSADLPAFARCVADQSLNGIIGDIRNYDALDPDELFARMMNVAREDINQLLDGKTTGTAGEELW